MLPAIREAVFARAKPLPPTLMGMAACSLLLMVLGIWYVFELAYIEMKTIKQNRRDRRRLRTIPWGKIAVTPKASKSKASFARGSPRSILTGSPRKDKCA
jgi:hypothetical protein